MLRHTKPLRKPHTYTSNKLLRHTNLLLRYHLTPLFPSLSQIVLITDLFIRSVTLHVSLHTRIKIA